MNLQLWQHITQSQNKLIYYGGNENVVCNENQDYSVRYDYYKSGGFKMPKKIVSFKSYSRAIAFYNGLNEPKELYMDLPYTSLSGPILLSQHGWQQ